MTPQELYALWAPDDSIWSPWVLPVPFAQLICAGAEHSTELPHFHLDWAPKGKTDVALVIDLPGESAIHLGLALLGLGFRPVPVIDGSPEPGDSIVAGLPKHGNPPTVSGVAVDMRGLLRALCQGAEWLRRASLAADAPPVFLLDAKRMESGAKDVETAYDNRWMAFPQDFPSGRFLRERGIRKVVLVHARYSKQPQEDLAHVLLRWQESGIGIESKFAWNEEAPVALEVSRPSRYRAAWYRAIAALGLRRNAAGGFGGYPRATSGAG